MSDLYNDFSIKNPIICGICDTDLIEHSTKSKVIYANAYDFPCVCESCWPHFVVASLVCQKVFGSQIAKAKRG